MKLNAVVQGKGLHELEPHAATREMLIGIGVVFTFGIEDSDRLRKHFVGHMMVTDDEVDAFALGVGYLFHRLDTAVEHNHQPDTGAGCIIHPLGSYAISLIVAIRDVIVDVRIELLNKLIDQGYSRGAIYVVVAVNQDTFFSSHGPIQTIDRYVHVFHQERVMKVRQLRSEEFLRCSCSLNPTLGQQPAQDGANSQFLSQLLAYLFLFGCYG